MRRIIVVAALVAALCWPFMGHCEDDVMAVGFQFSWTNPLSGAGPLSGIDPEGSGDLTDMARGGLHFRLFYRAVNISRQWQLVGEFGYNNFTLKEDEYLAPIGAALTESLNASFPLGPSLPAGSEAELRKILIAGGDLNAMHFTGGAKYIVFPDDKSRMQPYVTAQAGLYSVGQSDSDLSSSYLIHRPDSPDTTLSFPPLPWTRDVDRDNAFGLSVGGGAEFSLTKNFAVLGDARYHVAFTEDKRTTFVDLGVGVAYYLGF